MNNSFKNIIEQAKVILILIPQKPFFDQVAAGLSLYLAFRNQKDVQIYSPTPMTVEFNRLIGVNRISQELGNKNLVIRFVDYKASDIERVSYDIENSQFRLTVIPKQKVSPPTKEQVELTYSGISADTLILVGGTNESHFPALSSKELSSANIVHIGLRDLTLAINRNIISFSRPASSVCEVVASLIKESGIDFDEDISTNLLMGIEEASNNFTEPTVTANTFMVVAELMKSGGRRLSVQLTQQPAYVPGTIPTQFAKPAQPYIVSQSPQMSNLQFNQTRQSTQTRQSKSQQPIQSEQPEEVDSFEEPPKDWLTPPKIYKGTSVS